MEKQTSRELFESLPVPKAVRLMAVPTVIGQLIVLIYSMADTFFIGRTNDPRMVAAASLILPVFNIALSIAGLTGTGSSALVSRLLGQGRREEAKRAASFSLYLAFLMAAVFSLLILFFIDPLLRFLGAGADTFAFARTYALWVIAAGGIPTILSNVMSSMVRAVGESKKAGFGITMGGIINILLDPLFMFVLLPKGREIEGAAIATCLSNCITCAYFIVTILHMGRDSVLQPGPIRDLPEKSSIGGIFAVGVPAAVTTFLFDLDYIVIDRLMSGYGDTALAAVGIVLKAERLPLNTGIGLCQGMIPLVAYNYASGNRQRMQKISRFTLKIGVGFSLFSICLYELFAPAIMRFFIADAMTVSLGTGFLRARSLATVFMFLSFFHVHLFNSYGRGREALFLGIARWVVFNIPMLFLLNSLFGMYGIVWSQVTADILNVLLSVYVHRRFVKNNMPELL